MFPSCGNKPSDDTYKQQSKYFAADESLSPIINEELDIFNMKNKRDSIYPLYISEQEAVKYRPTCTELAYDALALIVNKANPDTLITVDTFRKIMAGEVTQWSELNPESKMGKIKVAFDNPKSGTLRYVVDSIMQGKQVKTDGNVKAAMTSAEVVEYVENNKNAIGVVGSIWLNDQRDTTNLTYNRNITVMKWEEPRRRCVRIPTSPHSGTSPTTITPSFAPSMPSA